MSYFKGYRSAYKEGISIFAVTHSDLQRLKDSNKDFRENVIIAVSNSSNDGASGLQKHYDMFEGIKASSVSGVRKAIYRISDCIFSGNPKDAQYFVGEGGDNPDAVKLKCGSLKPCIHGSDAHTEEKIFAPNENRYCWIKADPTFNGLRQILFEPFPGERVYIGESKPDRKDDFKVIKKLKFKETKDFPEEILFNQNLSSIIGSRSAGKSALLAYLADAIDSEQVRGKKAKGPGEGFPWENVTFDYSVEWANGKSNDESQGKIVYIPQNHLYTISEQPEEIKYKIKPVLEKKLPAIGGMYSKVERDIKGCNEEIRRSTEQWFELSVQIEQIAEEIKDLGAKNSVAAQKKKVDQEIKEIRDKYKLNASEERRYQKLIEKVTSIELRLETILEHMEAMGEDGKFGRYFREAEITLIPSIEDLPESAQELLNAVIDKLEKAAVSQINKEISKFAKELESEQKKLKKEHTTSSAELKGLIEKRERNEQLDSLMKKSSELKTILAELVSKGNRHAEIKKKVSKIEKEIAEKIKERESLLAGLKSEMDAVDQAEVRDMKFGIETGFSEIQLETLQQKLNARESTQFVNLRKVDMESIRRKPSVFLKAIYTGSQKINKGYDKTVVSVEALTLTEGILFTAEMEGDKIGGFSEPTMTPGKRALFALRLILAESEDTWPLLIDQPEDDLDSRSIYDQIVPFLREKKRERQIIMVSHNANLVVGADSEQIIVANRHGEDRKNENGMQFNYLGGSIEDKKVPDKKAVDTLKSQGIREHACEILEGGESAFEQRGNRYDLNRKSSSRTHP